MENIPQPLTRTKAYNTQQASGDVDRQDDSHREQADHRHQQDDVALEGQVCGGINATLAPDLLVPVAGGGGRGD